MEKKRSEPAPTPFKRRATVTFGTDVVEHPHQKHTGASPSSPPPIRAKYRKIQNMRDYNEHRENQIKENQTQYGQSSFNESKLLRKISMKSVAETIRLRDDESLQLEENEVDIDIENPAVVLHEMPENYFGNLDVSLMWEEKAILLLRFLQFYAFLLLLFFDTWPD